MSSLFKQPKGLYTLVFIEIWERFSFYGMRYCFVLYMMKEMLMSQQKASHMYGLYCSFAYFTPLIGGWLTDNYLGIRKAISIGSWMRFIGLVLLSTGINYLFVPSLFFISFAAGLMKAGMNPGVSFLYEKNETAEMDAGYRIFYIFANIGILISVLVCGYVGAHYSYRYAFMVAAFGIAIGQVGYILTASKTLGQIGLKPIKKIQEVKQKGFSLLEKQKLVVMFLLFFVFMCVHGICAEQIGNALTVFADDNINRVVFGFTIPTVWFQVIDPLVVWFMLPVLGARWYKKEKNGKRITYTGKIIMALLFMSLEYMILTGAGYFVDHGEKVSILWIIFAVFLQAMSAIYVHPIIFPLTKKLVPERMLSFMSGVALLHVSIANVISGIIGGLYSYMSKMAFFSMFVLLSFVFAFILLIIKKRLDVIIYK